ncbi:flagellin lysine-N-methylase [Beggiatoa alba]|nr:flagellin lysine-N-methylase [Beggiatoa alba]
MSRLVALPYMQQFKCIADQCEDTCCQNWHVRLDKIHYQRMADWSENEPGEKVFFSEKVILNDSEIVSDKSYAYIQMNENGFCPYFSVNKLCRLHAQQGIDMLPTICAYYPRIISTKNTTMELSGALSCPEVVRLCLSEDIDNHVLLKTDAAILPPREEILVHRKLVLDDSSPLYDKYFENVQQSFIDIIKLKDSDYFTRLYILASYSHSISTIYFEDCLALDPDALENYRLHVFDDSYKQSVSHFMAQYENEQPIACIVIFSILSLKEQQAPDEKLSKMVVQVFNHYAKQLGFDSYHEVQNAADYSNVFLERYQMFSNKVHYQVEDYLIKYLLNCFYREWFITMPSAFIYIQMLLVRVAIIRFLIYSRVSPEMSAAQIKEISVEVIYLFARAVDHNMPFLQVVYEALNEQQMLQFDYSAPLIKF